MEEQVPVREDKQGKQRLLPMLSFIFHGCYPEAFQELWLTIPFVDEPVLEPPSPNLLQVPGTEW